MIPYPQHGGTAGCSGPAQATKRSDPMLVWSSRTVALALIGLATITDATGRQVSCGSDAAGRMPSQVLPDGRMIGVACDANGNLTAPTPPLTLPHPRSRKWNRNSGFFRSDAHRYH